MAEYIKREDVLRKAKPKLRWDGFSYTFDEFIPVDDVFKIPIADVVEVVHGRWIYKNTCGPNTGKYHCSVCDKIPRSLCMENYCPNCGAKMDKCKDAN